MYLSKGLDVCKGPPKIYVIFGDPKPCLACMGVGRLVGRKSK